MHCDGLTIDCYTNAGGMTVRLRGDIDTHNAPEAAATLAGILDRSTGDVEVDVHGVAFVDSAGVRLLVELSRGMDAVHRRLSLVHPSPVFARIIELLESGAAAADRPSDPLARRESATLATSLRAARLSAHAVRSVTTQPERTAPRPGNVAPPDSQSRGTVVPSHRSQRAGC